MTSDQMSDLEAIRQLKARYFRLMDTQQWEAWADCFTADVSAFYEGAPRADPKQPVDVGLEGRAELVKGVSSLLRGAKSIHQGFMPELELTSPTTARGIWAMFDYVMLPTCHFQEEKNSSETASVSPQPCLQAIPDRRTCPDALPA
jgi:hypothetical protein